MMVDRVTGGEGSTRNDRNEDGQLRERERIAAVHACSDFFRVPNRSKRSAQCKRRDGDPQKGHGTDGRRQQ